jgi:hypothetical protein
MPAGMYCIKIVHFELIMISTAKWNNFKYGVRLYNKYWISLTVTDGRCEMQVSAVVC